MPTTWVQSTSDHMEFSSKKSKSCRPSTLKLKNHGFIFQNDWSRERYTRSLATEDCGFQTDGTKIDIWNSFIEQPKAMDLE
jgi:hypothetical protein